MPNAQKLFAIRRPINAEERECEPEHRCETAGQKNQTHAIPPAIRVQRSRGGRGIKGANDTQNSEVSADNCDYIRVETELTSRMT